MIVCDTGPLVAAALSNDSDHKACVELFTALHAARRELLVPATVVAEVGYLLAREVREMRLVAAGSGVLETAGPGPGPDERSGACSSEAGGEEPGDAPACILGRFVMRAVPHERCRHPDHHGDRTMRGR